MKKIIKNLNGNLYYNDICLKTLAATYGTPLKVTFLDIIKERVLELKKSFDQSIQETCYNGKFIYLNANKANYGALEVETAFAYSDGLETSSYHDLLLTRRIFEKHQNQSKLIVCNGYKKADYINEIIDIDRCGFKIINIIDSKEEYMLLKELHASINVGLRIHIPSLYAEEHEVVKNDRFGLPKKDFLFIIDDIKNTDMTLTTIHFHQRGFNYEKEKFIQNIHNVFDEYYVEAFRKVNTLTNFDIGGGTPLPEEEDFDYVSWAKLLLCELKQTCINYNVPQPNIISENGKYSQKDSTVNIYQVVGIKDTDIFPWYICDGSLLIALPEYYALGEPIVVTPITNLDKSFIKARLAGITCDCDDIYFEKSGYIMLPDTPDLLIGLLGTGSYQNSMNGKGGVHHCLLPEEKDLVIYTKDNQLQYYIRNDLQSFEEMLQIIKFAK